VLIVIPRAFSSGALSISSYRIAAAWPLWLSAIVIAAVSVVLPWSTCPIVPMFTCGFVLSNFAFAIISFPPSSFYPDRFAKTACQSHSG
jgi:hypothetical protein